MFSFFNDGGKKLECLLLSSLLSYSKIYNNNRAYLSEAPYGTPHNEYLKLTHKYWNSLWIFAKDKHRSLFRSFTNTKSPIASIDSRWVPSWAVYVTGTPFVNQTIFCLFDKILNLAIFFKDTTL